MAAVLNPIIDAEMDTEKEYELVNGQREEKILAGALHGGVGLRLGAELWMYVKSNFLGGVYGPDTTFKIGKNERLPDIAFVAASRNPQDGEPEGLWPIAPDLAIEMVSLTDLHEKLMSKILEYLEAGVRQVWIVSLEHRMVTVYSSPTDVNVFQEMDELDGGDLLPGFRLQIAKLFKNPGRPV